MTLWLPQAPHTASKVANVEHERPLQASERARVLLVDDDHFVRNILAEQLSDYYDVACASDGLEALEFLKASPGVDMLVSDLTMPGIDGMALIREAQRRIPTLQAVLLTGCDADVVQLAVCGAVTGSFSLLRKPATSTQLVDRIDTLLISVSERQQLLRTAGGRPQL